MLSNEDVAARTLTFVLAGGEGRRLNPLTGEVTDFPVPTPDSNAQSGALGSDGAIWFVERNVSKVGRMTLDGHFTESARRRRIAEPDRRGPGRRTLVHGAARAQDRADHDRRAAD